MSKVLKIVPPDQIPKPSEVRDVDSNNLIDTYIICTQMQTLCVQSGGIGLSAVQVGIPLRLYVAVAPGTPLRSTAVAPFKFFANCSYFGEGEKVKGLEGCLSLKDDRGLLKRFLVPRFPKIKLTGFTISDEGSTPELKPLELELSGQDAVLHQHEIDHHWGVLVSDIGEEVNIWR